MCSYANFKLHQQQRPAQCNSMQRTFRCGNRKNALTMALLTLCALLLEQQLQTVCAGSITKGLTRQRSAKIANVHGLQVAAESLSPRVIIDERANATTTTTSTITTTDNNMQQQPADMLAAVPGVATSGEAAAQETAAQRIAGKYEIHSVSGEPNYKSVNLTWEVEFVPATATTNNDTITSGSVDVEPPKLFQIYFCEMQSFGPHRCRSKLVNTAADATDADYAEGSKQVRHYVAQIENLRMATKYSFHIRAQQKKRNMKITARSELFDNELNNEIGGMNALDGQTIIIPTKGFSAQATRCLPHASEIEVETGPYFGGKIVVDGGNCGIKGNPNDPVDKYTFRIDHKMCGSMVKPETNTVETFITVQENLGIFTYSTRRFVVVCSYQSGMQTVRASFTVPGKGGVVAAYDENEAEGNDPFIPDERIGREQRYMRYVNKSELVLKESSEEFADDAGAEQAAVVEEVPDPALPAQANDEEEHDAINSVPALSQVLEKSNESVNGIDNDVPKQKVIQIPVTNARLAKYAKLIIDQPMEKKQKWYKVLTVDEEGRGFTSSLRYVTANMGSVILTVTLSVILVGICLFLIYRQSHRRAKLLHHKETKGTPQQHQHKQKHLKNKTLPRALQQTCLGTM